MIPWVLVGALFVAVIALSVKIYVMRSSAKEICRSFSAMLENDTNTLITISSSDRHMCNLAAEINRQLTLLKKEKYRFVQGDAELKSAMTNISHDLRTPITAICGYLDLLEKEEKSQTAEKYLDVIRGRMEILRRLMEELFAYSVIMSDTHEIKNEAVDIGKMLEESVIGFYTALSERGIELKITLPDTSVIKNTDKELLTRVFGNILNNAVKYSRGDLEITLTEKGECVFTNTANEMTEVQVGRLFDRFYTVEAARQSTGLGLSIAKTIVRSLGGNIYASYVDGRLSITVRLK